MGVIGMAFVCQSVCHSVRLSCSLFTKMFPLVRRCAEPMTRPRRLKVKVNGQGHVFYPILLCMLHISLTLWPVSLDFAQMFLSVRRCAEPITLLRRLKVTVQGHEFYPLVSCRLLNFVPTPYLMNPEWFSLNFTQIFLSVRRCAEPMTQLHRLEVRVWEQGHGFNTLISCPPLISRTLWTIFIQLHTNFPLSETVYRTHYSATQTQGHTSRWRYSAAGDLAVFQTAVLFEIEIPNLVCGCIFRWWSVAYHFGVTVTLTCRCF